MPNRPEFRSRSCLIPFVLAGLAWSPLVALAADGGFVGKNGKLGSHLQDHFFSSADGARVQRSARLSVERSELVVVSLESLDYAGAAARFSELGLVPEFVSRDGRSATLRISHASELEQLATLPWVSSIRTAPPAILRRGSVTSRAGLAMRSDQMASRYSVDGEGQIVGILSDSFAVTDDVRTTSTTPARGVAGQLQGSKPQRSGDLPSSVRLFKDATSGTDEGAAMAELVHDVAPGAALAFHTAGVSRQEFAQGIDTLCSNGNATIVVDDILFVVENNYQDDLPAIAAGRCVEQGIPYLSAVGNDGDQGHRYVFRDANPVVDENGTENVPTGNDLHNWLEEGTDPYLELTLPPNSQLYVVLNWNQPGATVRSDRGAQIDLDLYVTTERSVSSMQSGHPGFVASSRDPQGSTGAPSGDPVEWVELVTEGAPKTFYIAVEHYKGRQDTIPQQPSVPLEFRLLYTGADVLEAKPAFNYASSWGHALAPGIISVAAVPWWESPEFVPEKYTTGAIDPESFTSRGGGQPVQFDRNGNYLVSQRYAPTISAIDGNNNTFLGGFTGTPRESGEHDEFPNFFGTSAAAPNLAAALAILKQTFPAATLADLQAALADSAIDVTGFRAAAGPDDVTGAGLIDVDAAAVLLQERVGRDGAPPAPGPAPAPSVGSGGGGGGPCFIATAAYGSFLADEVWMLRKFRDEVLLSFPLGRHFVEFYYRHSPPLANAIAESPSARAVVRVGLSPLIMAIKYPATALCLLLAMIGGGVIYRQRRQVLEKAS